MKRILFFLMLGATITGCNDKAGKEAAEDIATDSTAVETAKMAGNKVNCRDLTDYDAIDSTDVEQRAEWLQKYGNDVCKEILWASVFREHTVNPSNFSLRQGASTVTKTWAEMKYLMDNKGYERYITFDIDINHNINDVITTTTYSRYPFCFSTALFESINDSMSLTDQSEFTFYPAKRGLVNALYFKVVKKDNLGNQVGNPAYFDISDNPKIPIGTPASEQSILSPL